MGADACIDYRKSKEDQIKDILDLTNGKLSRVFDVTAGNHEFGMAVFNEIADSSKHFATTCDW
jgi:hypothetical protein